MAHLLHDDWLANLILRRNVVLDELRSPVDGLAPPIGITGKNVALAVILDYAMSAYQWNVP